MQGRQEIGFTDRRDRTPNFRHRILPFRTKSVIAPASYDVLDANIGMFNVEAVQRGCGTLSVVSSLTKAKGIESLPKYRPHVYLSDQTRASPA